MDTDKLKLNVLNLCSRIEGKKAIVIEDLKTGEAVEINRDEVFPAASLIKVPVLSALFRMAKENQIALDERIELEKGNSSRIGGFGISRLGNRLNPAVRLAVLMIALSDNAAANLLIDKVRMSQIILNFQAMRNEATVLQRNVRFTGKGEGQQLCIRRYAKPMKAILENNQGEMICL